MNRILNRVVGAVVRAYHRQSYAAFADRWHPHNALLQDALETTVDYIKSNMADAMIRQDALGVLTYASRQACVEGLYMEFGVRTGSTINHIARINPDDTIYGFDSFEGLPEDWTGWTQEKGTFRQDGAPQVDRNVQLIEGWFDESLPPFLAEHPEDVALIHIDSDLYSSAKTVLDALAPRIRPGTVIVFNEYFNYPNWKAHEFRAFREFCDTNSVDYEYLCWGMYEVAVRINAITQPG